MNPITNVTKQVELVKTVAATGTPEKLTRNLEIDTITRLTSGDSGIVKVVFLNPHGYVNGARVTITGANESEFNVSGAIVTKVTSVRAGDNDDAIWFKCAGTTALASGTFVITASIKFRQATLLGKKNARTVNTGIVYLGNSSGNSEQSFSIASDGEVLIGQANGGPMLDLGDYYLDVLNNDDGIIVRYH